MHMRKFAVGVAVVQLAQVVWGLTYDTCKVVPAAGLSIIKYYREKCVHCQRIAPKITKIIDSIEKHGTPVMGLMVDTDKCHDEGVKLEAIPTIVVQNNGLELLRFSGDRPYTEIAEMIGKATGISTSVFTAMPEARKSLLHLTKSDFLSGFAGPWVIYFEDSYNHVVEDILLQTYKAFDNEIKIAKYVGADKEIVAGRYYIYDFPGILVMYDGILMRYNGEMTLAAFHEFCSRLVEPSFKEVTAEELQSVQTPTFVVFYSDPIQANRTFRRIAHDLKMNAITHKMKVEANEGEQVLRLAVFKNGTKFYYSGDINDEGSVREWLFHSHFPNTSKLSMDNFYSIFHGLKPVISIITDGGNNREISIFEEAALAHNRGNSSSPYVFTFIDKKEYPKFTETNFGPLHNKPLVVFFNPEKQVFYGERIKANESFDAYLQRQIQAFESQTIPTYTKEAPLSYRWILLAAGLIIGVGSIAKLGLATRKKLALE
ncbi:hypothetical protein NEHOM01_1343 [Nematocida homosporus]|uniref:uncharacterized protein n=1 Tax=Nematocida homosporus TaxID=1912981 RepID=UPI0022211CC4|nr:uncharacterized protein NEHOM01_1343 [Nematocida homosporus]KAI5186254.1 hypothetical protein NEHOM01_1343 [Nematocida homosporus]